MPLGLTAVALAADAGLHNKILGSRKTSLVISNDKMKDIMKKVKSLEDSGLLLKGVTKTIEIKIKEWRGGFLSMLLGTSGVSLIWNLLSDRGVTRAEDGVIRADDEIKK